MKRLIAMLMLLASVSLAGNATPVVPVSVHAHAEQEAFEAGKPIPVRVTLTNGLSETIRFTTFATEPNEWNGETFNISLVDVYRNKKQWNTYAARPEIQAPLTIAGPASFQILPNKTLTVIMDISKWKIQGGWTEGTYELVIRMDHIGVDDKVRMSILSAPVPVTVQ